MKRFGLIGRSLGHSFSKSFFESFFQENNIDAEYSNFELESIDDFHGLNLGELSGLNVTIPYKEEILPFMDNLDPVASEIGAVNTIQFVEGKMIGHNTDVYGFLQSIKPFLTNKHERAMILGSGGASKAVKYALKSIGVDPIVISRHPQGADQFSYEMINSNMIAACRLIVNCTPVGMYPNVDGHIILPMEAISVDHLVVDVIYNPSKTKFLSIAEAAGSTILNGESMLHLQAMKSWEIWNS